MNEIARRYIKMEDMHDAEIISEETGVEKRKDTEVITFGGAGMPETFQSDEEMENAIQVIERRNHFIERVTKLALKTLMPTDFHDFNGKPLLQGIGAQRLIKYFGISVKDMQRLPGKGYEIVEEDTAGRLRVTYAAHFVLGSLDVIGVGMRDTHNKFLCKTQEGFKELKNIELPDLDRSAKTAMYRDGVCTLLGLNGLTWEYLAELGFKPEQTTGNTFIAGSKGGATKVTEDTKILQDEIREMLMEMSNNVEGTAKVMLENYTTFKGKDGKQIKGKNNVKYLSEKQAPVIHSQVKKDYNEFVKQTQNTPPQDDARAELGF